MKKEKYIFLKVVTGFLGSHMVDLLLKKNMYVRVIDNFSNKQDTTTHYNNKKDIKNYLFFIFCDKLMMARFILMKMLQKN